MPSSEAAPGRPASSPTSSTGLQAGRHAPTPGGTPPTLTRQLPRFRLDPWTLVLGGAVLLAAAFTLVPALFPQPRVPTVTRAALPAATSPAPATPEAPVYPTTSSIEPLISGRLDLNSASLEQLEALPKVGPALAARIVAGRPYRSLADLDRVKGIGPAALQALEPLVSF
ncbi:helix-hairpin-helix domain-containing protein [Deinococcus sedimenti]|uniref:Competence protein ComEA n=1 Tax=Deinococcus sedimenti TaxID=1867090 RepID=A0ABQ2S4Z6_9DEIO|nr:helix-hairpin-helix domain-containing protein [Deinococcus sedimenti]GGR91034.1 competence protein ComEA [Deinococcus sedimenti]